MVQCTEPTKSADSNPEGKLTNPITPPAAAAAASAAAAAAAPDPSRPAPLVSANCAIGGIPLLVLYTGPCTGERCSNLNLPFVPLPP